jgi:hypothetical protein
MLSRSLARAHVRTFLTGERRLFDVLAVSTSVTAADNCETLGTDLSLCPFSASLPLFLCLRIDTIFCGHRSAELMAAINFEGCHGSWLIRASLIYRLKNCMAAAY